MNPDSSSKTTYLIGAIVVIAALGLWYYYSMQPQTATAPTTLEESPAPLTSGDTTADISADLSQLPDDTATLNQNAAASADAVEGF